MLTLHIAIANSMFLLNVITMNKLYLEETVLLIYVENRFKPLKAHKKAVKGLFN